MLYPNGDPNYRKLRPEIAFKPGDGPPLMTDSRLHWHPSLTPLAELHDQGKVTVFPAIGYTHPDQSHFTSRHYWEVGALDPQQGAGWLGRILDVIGDDENAMQGLSLDSSLLPSLATAKVPSRRSTDPTDYGFDSHNVWDVPGALLPDAMGALGGLNDTTDPFLTQASQTARREPTSSAASSARFIGPDGQAHYHSKVKYPDGDFAQPALRPRRAPPCRVSRSGPRRCRRPASSTRTRTRPARSPTASSRPRRRSPPSRPTSSSATSARACSPSSGASSAAGPSRTTRTAPITAPRASRS